MPTHVLAGIWLWRQRRAGELLAPIVLAFGILMAASIGGMMVVMRVTGSADAETGVIIAMFTVAAATAAAFAHSLRPRDEHMHGMREARP